MLYRKNTDGSFSLMGEQEEMTERASWIEGEPNSRKGPGNIEIANTPEERAEILAEWEKNTAPKTQAEIDAEQNEKVAQNLDTIKAVALALLDGINDTRTRAGQPEFTVAQLKNRIKTYL